MNPSTDGQQPSWRLWGEEKIADAVYTVYLKKVRYHPSTCVNDGDDGVSHLEWETVRVRVIKAGTLERLVDALAHGEEGTLEPTNLNVFLATYRAWATPEQVLQAFFQRYQHVGEENGELEDVTAEQHRQALVQALVVWLDVHPEDWYDPPQFLTLHQLLSFVERNLPGSSLEMRTRHRLHKLQLREQSPEGQVLFFEQLPWNTLLTGSGATTTEVPHRLEDVPEAHFAQQLTWMDAELFRRLVPHHCLGSMWRKRKGGRDWSRTVSNTAAATVRQFNAVSCRVTASLLERACDGPRLRARRLAKWIDIAQELRLLKNFSSLKAIVAALESEDIYRLQRVWSLVPPSKQEAFRELARIFSGDEGQITCRELMLKEGAAKFADTAGENDRHLQKAMQRQGSSNTVMQGTVPYLGIFLTDLTMMDAALPDVVGGEQQLLNFDKRRREFRVLAQIKLLQSAANCYNLQPDPGFLFWFQNLPTLSQEKSYELSCLIEPPANPRKQKGNATGEIRESDSASSSSGGPAEDPGDGGSLPPQLAGHLASPQQHLSASTSNLSALSLSSPAELKVIRVSVEQPHRNEAQGLNLYKSLLLSNRDRTHTVVRSAMEKHGLTGSPDDYVLAQQLPQSEIVFPPSANVFYAVSTAYEPNFVLRPKSELPPSPLAQKKLLRKPFLLKKKAATP